MVFHSIEFAVFFALVWAAYLSLGHRLQNRMLLVASYAFYASWDWRFLSLIVLTTITDFFCARAIHGESDKAIRKRWVAVSCTVNLGVLGVFKYFDFFVENLAQLSASVGLELSYPMLNVILPVGISFYTFQSMSYTLDVFRKQVKPADHFLDYALYVSFFPQLVAGPIERAKHLLPQILEPRRIRLEQLEAGVFLIGLGIFKKIFVADNLGRIVDPIFRAGADPSSPEVLLGGYAFLFQVYCDFSAYTDMARGTAKLMGFELMDNFNAPYFARNVQDFWARWHISLTTWIRDYLYYPLAFKRFNKKSIPAPMITIITFTIMGLWHGAAWGYVLWGLYNGIVLAGYGYLVRRWARAKKGKNAEASQVRSVANALLTFHVILIGDLFFRSGSLAQALGMAWSLFTDFRIPADIVTRYGECFFYIVPMLLLDWLMTGKNRDVALFQLRPMARYAAYYVMFLLVVKFGTATPSYIYFQF